MKAKCFLFLTLCFFSFLSSKMAAEEVKDNGVCMHCGSCLPLPPPFDCPCSTCGYNVNFEGPVEYVDYKPWETSPDPGLYCLPGTHCRYLCPSKPTGAELYKPWAETVHTKRRFPSERTPEDWHTIMMLMRVMAPMPACDFRKITAFLMGKSYGSPPQSRNRASPEPSQEEETSKKGDLSFLDEEKKESPNVNLSSLDEEKSKPEEKKESSSVNLSFLEEAKKTSAPLPEIIPEVANAISSNIHTVFGGHLFLDYVSRTDRGTALNGPSDFQTLFHPLFLASYRDSLLLAAAVEFQFNGAEIDLDLHYAKVIYFFNDWITLEFGKLVLPFGVYPMWWEPLSEFVFTPWIRDEMRPIAPDGDIGIEVQGAIPLCGLIGPYFDCAIFTYDFWIGNGPFEEDGDIVFEANSHDNNSNKAFGGRVAFWPNPLAVLGFSFMRARWNSTDATGNFPKDRLHYTGLCADWNWNIGDYFNLKGEYIWSEYDFTPQTTITRHGYWAQGSVFFTILASINRNLYCSWQCFWDSLQFGFRGGQLWSSRHEEDRNRIGFVFTYYLTESAKCQLEYDINGGAEGYRENVFGLRLYWDW